MRIGIDAKFLTHPQKGGFKSYTENLIAALAELDRQNEYILYVDREPQSTDLIPKRPNFTVKVVSGNYKAIGMPWREQVLLPRQLGQDRLDVFHSLCLTAPLFTRVPTVVTIHDMIWYYPARYATKKTQLNKRKLMEWYYKYIPNIAARRAKAVITVSNASKKSIVEYMNLKSDGVFVTYEAANSLFRPAKNGDALNRMVQENNLKSNYILAIGSADPRKNIKTLIRAYAQLPDQLKDRHQLAVVWNHKSLAPDSFLEAQNLDVMKYIHFLDNVSDEDLLALYNQASLFIFPSLEEGFGLPPLEAMACGTPVVAADNSSIPEIVGDAAVLFSATNTDELVNSITRVLTEPALQRKLSDCGLERAAHFSWKECALKTVDVYKTVSNGQLIH